MTPQDSRIEVISYGKYKDHIMQRLDKLVAEDVQKRLWSKDVTLWGDHHDAQQISDSLGWLDVTAKMLDNLPELQRFTAEVRAAGFNHVVHLGMGGSSLAPLVFAETLPRSGAGLPLTVLDSTNPQSVLRVANKIDAAKTLFIVASKSGTTTETVTFMEYFYGKMREIKGDRAGENFIAITDPGSLLIKTAEERRFRRCFLNYADIGGRYSALSYFGMVPAALIGNDIERLLKGADRLAGEREDPTANPTVSAHDLGGIVGELALHGRDKLTFIAAEAISSLGLWLEQLIAESTGKEGKGVLPVAGEEPGGITDYGNDRVFVYFEFQGNRLDGELASLQELAGAGHPVIKIALTDAHDVGQEMMRWEIATAIMGWVLGINPFDQPNVQESKEISRRILNSAIKRGTIPALENSKEKVLLDVASPTLEEDLFEFLQGVNEGDYFAIQAYITATRETDAALAQFQRELRDRFRIATTVGYGPRYLHSTGQYHKGGPNKGVFIQLLETPTQDVEIPGQEYSIGLLFNAQAQGDLEALLNHQRRVVRVSLGSDSPAGLLRLIEALSKASAEAGT